MRLGLVIAACIGALFAVATGTRTGDEDFGPDVAGRFYVFADEAIHIINPLTLSVDTTLLVDQSDKPLTNAGSVGSKNTTRSWNDATFVEDAALGFRYVYVNEGDIYENSTGGTFSYVTAIDAVTQKVSARLSVGARPVHIYSVNETSAVWSHSDAEGTFYVINVAQPNNFTTKKVPSFLNNPGHGKLVVNTGLYPLSYGTNVNEQVISKFNLEGATRLATFQYNTSLPNATICVGTHTIVYSRVNEHLFIECVDGTGTLEWDTVTDKLVHLHDIPGVLTGAPADDIIFVGNNDESTAAVILPGANGKASTVIATLQVPYNPDYPAFYSNSSVGEDPQPYTDYTVFFPLTRNTNINDIMAATAVDSNVTHAGYSATPDDCEYSNSTTAVSASSVSSATSPVGLTLATGSNGQPVTPTCGACAAGVSNEDPSQFNASLSGFGVLDLSIFAAGPLNTSTRLLPAGAIAPSISEATGANQCSFNGEAHRAIKRGGSFVATVADFPQSSIYIVDAALPNDPLYGRGYVPTSPHPAKIVWVPAFVD